MSEPDIAFAVLERESGERFQGLRRQLGVHSFGMNLMVLQPGQRTRIHAHEHQEEVYIVLEGQLTLLIDGDEHLLEADHLARVGPAMRRQLVNVGRDPLIMLALGGAGEHAGRDARAWTSWEEDGPGLAPQDVPLPADLPTD
jgi:uncharacterized cupin superfamily protein